MTASCPVQTDSRMSLHRYQNEIAQLIIVRNTASFKKSYNEGQAAGCSRCKCDRRDSNPSHQNGASLITAMLQIVKGLLCQTLHFCCLIDHVAVKSAGANPAKAGPGRGVQYNAHFTSKTWVTLNGRKNSIPSQIYSSTSYNCLHACVGWVDECRRNRMNRHLAQVQKQTRHSLLWFGCVHTCRRPQIRFRSRQSEFNKQLP